MFNTLAAAFQNAALAAQPQCVSMPSNSEIALKAGRPDSLEVAQQMHALGVIDEREEARENPTTQS